MTPEQKLRTLMVKIGIGIGDAETIIDHVKSNWHPNPAAGTGNVVTADAPPPQGPGGFGT
jgi:hypothetical protein